MSAGRSVGVRLFGQCSRPLAWGTIVSYWEGNKPANQDKPAGAVLARPDGKELWRFKSFVRDDFFTLAGSRDGQRLAVLEVPGKPAAALSCWTVARARSS